MTAKILTSALALLTVVLGPQLTLELAFGTALLTAAALAYGITSAVLDAPVWRLVFCAGRLR